MVVYQQYFHSGLREHAPFVTAFCWIPARSGELQEAIRPPLTGGLPSVGGRGVRRPFLGSGARPVAFCTVADSRNTACRVTSLDVGFESSVMDRSFRHRRDNFRHPRVVHPGCGNINSIHFREERSAIFTANPSVCSTGSAVRDRYVGRARPLMIAVACGLQFVYAHASAPTMLAQGVLFHYEDIVGSQRIARRRRGVCDHRVWWWQWQWR